ncbi:hypothetical protein CLF_102691 [Clonorchis sinensis]|uniref:Pol-related protein n=1 Tax=Clonorchis sinensis TaxID=79923 RepID=G7Y8C8_CLOSI|nr:hypothetical protein CLF_102691 [Clonorchis sinensis]
MDSQFVAERGKSLHPDIIRTLQMSAKLVIKRFAYSQLKQPTRGTKNIEHTRCVVVTDKRQEVKHGPSLAVKNRIRGYPFEPLPRPWKALLGLELTGAGNTPYIWFQAFANAPRWPEEPPNLVSARVQVLKTRKTTNAMRQPTFQERMSSKIRPPGCEGGGRKQNEGGKTIDFLHDIGQEKCKLRKKRNQTIRSDGGEQQQVKTFAMDKLTSQMLVSVFAVGRTFMLRYLHILKAVGRITVSFGISKRNRPTTSQRLSDKRDTGDYLRVYTQTKKYLRSYIDLILPLRISLVNLKTPRCTKHCTSQPNDLLYNVRYGTVQKPKYVRQKSARHCRTLFGSTPVTAPFLHLVVPFHLLVPLTANMNKLFTCPKPPPGRAHSNPPNLLFGLNHFGGLSVCAAHKVNEFPCSSHSGLSVVTNSLYQGTFIPDSTPTAILKFRIPYGAHVRPLLEYANPVVYSGRTKDVILIERVQRAAKKMVAGLKSMDYETRLVVLDLFPLEYRRLRGDLILTYALFEQGLANKFFTVDPANTRRGNGDLILTYALFEQGLANKFFTVDPANTRRGNGERQLLNDKNKTDPGNLGESLAPVYQSVNP